MLLRICRLTGGQTLEITWYVTQVLVCAFNCVFPSKKHCDAEALLKMPAHVRTCTAAEYLVLVYAVPHTLSETFGSRVYECPQ